MDYWTWDSAIAPSSESWVIENADRSGGVSTVGTEQIVSSTSSRWRASLSFMLFHEEAPCFRAFAAWLRGRSRNVFIGPFDLIGAPQPGTTSAWALGMGIVSSGQTALPIKPPADGSIIVDAPLRSQAVNIRMQGGRRQNLGNYIRIGTRLHILTQVINQNDTDSTCFIEPLLREDVTAGAVVSFGDPRCMMRLANPLTALPIVAGDNTTSVTLDLVEVP